MGHIKEINVELDGGYSASITAQNVVISGGSSLLLTSNDLEQCQALMHYIREVQATQPTKSKLSGEYPVIDFPELPTLETGTVKKR